MANIVKGEEYYNLDGQLAEIKRQLRQPNGYPFDPEKLKKHLQNAIEGEFGKVKTQNEYLSLISGSKELILDAVDGSETLAEAKDTFVWIDSDLKNWNTDHKGPATEKTPVLVYEMAKDAIFAQMFGSFSSDLRKLCLTQHQIKNFVRKHRNWLRSDGYATFFLFESNGEFFVAYVLVDSVGLNVDVFRFERSYVWRAGGRPRLVVPARNA